jgi:hypothetical protein
MFLISQLILSRTKICNIDSIPTYSIALGIILYTGIYLYTLYSSNEQANIFSKFIVYIIGADLLISTYVHFRSQTDNTIQLENNDYTCNDESESDSESESMDITFVDEDRSLVDAIPNIDTFDTNQEEIEAVIQADTDIQECDKNKEDDIVETMPVQEKRKRGRPKKAII